MPHESERFAHGEFWNHYSRVWEDEVQEQTGSAILGEEWMAAAGLR